EMTDHTGTVIWKAEYKAWGECKAEKAKSNFFEDSEIISNNIRFQGQYFDEETGLHYNRYRYYSPYVGRFISKDPIGLLGGHNVYAYAPNPVGWIDPLGLNKNCPPTTLSNDIPDEFKKVNGGSDKADFITPHSEKHLYDDSKTSTKNRSQFGQDINVKALREDTMRTGTVVYNAEHNTTKYSKSYDFNISTKDTPTGEMRVFVSHDKPTRSTQFPYVDRGNK
ncbi:RHS repeat-associated core domain-containing protein, partial [Acinetobacter baumannii]|nr:RHS repeat-associated core domain-containing protein [Acinetobacter baumannii]